MAASFQEGRGPGGREKFREMRDQVKALPASYQQEFRKGMRDMFQDRMEKRMRDYLAMDKASRRADVLKQNAEDEKRRAEREKRRQEREAQAAKNGGSSNSQRGNGQGGSGNGNGNGNGPDGSNGQQGGRGGGGGGLAARLDNSTPQFRAMMAEYVRDINRVRIEEGLPPMRFWGRR